MVKINIKRLILVAIIATAIFSLITFVYFLFSDNTKFVYTKALASYESSEIYSNCIKSGSNKEVCAVEACRHFYLNWGGEKTENQCSDKYVGAYSEQFSKFKPEVDGVPAGRPTYLGYMLSSFNLRQTIGIIFMMFPMTIFVVIIFLFIGLIIGFFLELILFVFRREPSR